MDTGPITVATRLVDGSLADFRGFASLGPAIREMERRAVDLPVRHAAWLISGDPHNPYSRVLDTRAGSRV